MFDVLSPDKLARIRELNDTLRTTFSGGRVLMTASVAALGPEIKAAAMMTMREFSNFNDANDPHGEHDFGTFQLGHYTFNWQISYYDLDLAGCSEDPADASITKRVLILGFPADL